MRISRVSPSFKGFIYSSDDKIAVNAKHITSMREKETDDGVKTLVCTVDKMCNTISAPLEQVLKAYSRASANETYYVKVEDYAVKNTKKPYSI